MSPPPFDSTALNTDHTLESDVADSTTINSSALDSLLETTKKVGHVMKRKSADVIPFQITDYREALKADRVLSFEEFTTLDLTFNWPLHGDFRLYFTEVGSNEIPNRRNSDVVWALKSENPDLLKELTHTLTRAREKEEYKELDEASDGHLKKVLTSPEVAQKLYEAYTILRKSDFSNKDLFR